MDTNLVTLLQLLQAGRPPASDTTLLICSMILTALVPTLAALAAYLKARTSSDDAHETKKVLVSTAEGIEKIHVAVNSERTAALDEIKNLRLDVLKMATELATLREDKHASEVAKALATPAGAPRPTP